MLIADGDSLTEGIGSTGGNTYPAQLAVIEGKAVANRGHSGDTMATMINEASADVDALVTLGSTVLVWGGTNDLAGGASAATVYARIQNYCAGRRYFGLRCAVLTMLPRSDAGLPGSFEVDRQTINTNIRNNWATFADSLVDVAADGRIGDAGDELDSTYYNADKVHLKNAGYAIVASIASTQVQ
jgi:lysophospholipase L1-like esterase